MNSSSSCGAVSRADNLCTRPIFSATRPRGSPPWSISFNTHLPLTSLDSSATLCLRKNPGRKSYDMRATAVYRPGLVAMEKKRNFYDLLGIPEGGSFAEIKHAYKRMALKYHPDVSPLDQMAENTQRFIQVQEAYETLSDPKSREMYDRKLRLSFCAGRRLYKGLEEIEEWKIRWQNQVSELKMRSWRENSYENMSWGARMRRKKAEAVAVAAEN